MVIMVFKEPREPRNFEEDLSNSNNPLLRKAWEKILRYKFGRDCEIYWKDDKCIQLGLGTDTVVKTSKGRRFSVETKTRNFNCLSKDYIMEIVTHVYDREEKPRIHLRSKEGWIYSTTAEYIFHATLNKDETDILEVIFYSLSPFKLEKYKSEFEQYENLWLATKYDDSGRFQLTLNKLIPVEVIKKDSEDFWEWRANGN